MSRPRWGGATRVKSDVPCPGSQGTGAARPGSARKGSAQAWTPSNWSEGLQTESLSDELSPASVSDPVPPGFTLAYRITGPEGETCGARGCARVQGDEDLPERRAG